MPANRLVVIDAGLQARLAVELRTRGRAARSLRELGWHRLEDPELLGKVFADHPGAVLVTGDDSLPQAQVEKVEELRATVATLEPYELHIGAVEPPDGETSEQEAYEREIVHRWVQVMQDQPLGAIRRYFLWGRRPWRARR